MSHVAVNAMVAGFAEVRRFAKTTLQMLLNPIKMGLRSFAKTTLKNLRTPYFLGCGSAEVRKNDLQMLLNPINIGLRRLFGGAEVLRTSANPYGMGLCGSAEVAPPLS
jgi:hypothetical protein